MAPHQPRRLHDRSRRPCRCEQPQQTDADKIADLPERGAARSRGWRPRSPSERQAYQELPKRKFVGARTQSVVYAEYVDDWRQKIERVGTANFPPEARERAEFGSVLVTVAIKADGSVEKVEIDRSSGRRVLDAAVERIVQLASPFKPFPANVRQRDRHPAHHPQLVFHPQRSAGAVAVVRARRST